MQNTKINREANHHFRDEPPFPRMRGDMARLRMVITLIFCDALGLLLSGTLAIVARLLLRHGLQWSLYAQVLPLTGLLMLGYAISELYPGIRFGPVEELRRLSLTTTTVVFCLAGLTFFARNPENYSRLTLGLTWFFSLVLLPVGRNVLRGVAAHFQLWGEPVLVIGYAEGGQGRHLVRYLRANRSIGYNPVAVLGNFGHDMPTPSDGNLLIPAQKGWQRHPALKHIKTAILILNEIPDGIAHSVIQEQMETFRRVILIPEQVGLANLGITPVTLDGIVGMKVHNNLNSLSARIQKRLIDIFGAIVGLMLLSPIFGVLALVIKLSSRGRVFYPQKRVGKDEEIYRMLKFRTMIENADQALEDVLEKDPQKRSEWEIFQKLKDDPRIYPFGEIMRKYSLDELPQLWNVLKGEMSLVGPRPFLPEQQEKYGAGLSHYVRVLPGITGMWQVTVRNQSEFCERPYWDEYYVRNWSIWLDIFISIPRIPTSLLVG